MFGNGDVRVERAAVHRTLIMRLTIVLAVVVLAAACSSGDDATTTAGNAAVESEAASAETNPSNVEAPADVANNAAEPADVSPPGDRATEGLVSLYSFDEGGGDQVLDSAGGYDLTIANLDAVEWFDGGLRLAASTTLGNPDPPVALLEALDASNELSVEVWLETNDLEQSGPARIVSISGDTQNRNLTLGQGVHGGTGNFLDFRLRSTETDDNGTPSLGSPDDALTTELTHVVASRSADGTTRMYFDGVLQSSGSAGGDLANWDRTYRLLLGNETTGDRPWLGSYHSVALYSRALTDAEVAANFRIGPA